MRGKRRALVALVGVLAAATVAVLLAGGASAQSPPFTQCPAVGADKSCGYLITVTNGAAPAITQDPSQPAYENSEDVLVGVQNNSSSSITALPLSSMGSSLFVFESDGICDPGVGSAAPGCQPVPGSPAGTVCGPAGTACSFPPPPGEPRNYTDAPPSGTVGNPWANGDKQSGYEGPTSWFSSFSADGSSGTVNFSPPLAPGQSTYFGLEQPPTGGMIVAGSPTTTPPPPKVLPPAFGKNGVLQVPSNKACLSKRHFKIHIRKIRGLTYISENVFLGGKSVGKVSGPRLATGVDLRGLPQGTFTIKIIVLTGDGRVIQGKRTYHTCATKRLPGHPHLL
jgi:hypothetical protein